MEIQLSLHQKMLLELLKAALTRKPILDTLFKPAIDTDWMACYKFAKKQGVMAIAWDGIQMLSRELLPPKQIKLSWALQVEKQEKRYERYVKTIVELKDFYAQHGIALVLLKGVGLSSYYLVPEHREGGDLDIYTYSLDHAVMSDEEANQLADKLMIEKGIVVDQSTPKHSEFSYHGVPVENHHYFLNEYKISYAKSVDEYLHNICGTREVALLNGDYKVPIPSPAFNGIFVPFHTMQHWGNGLCLHQLCDCAVIMNKYGLNLSLEELNPNFKKALATFAVFSNRYLGTHIKVDSKESMLDLLMQELFSPRYNEDEVTGNFLNVFFFKSRRLYYRMKVNKEVVGGSMFQPIKDSIFRVLKNPMKLCTFRS